MAYNDEELSTIVHKYELLQIFIERIQKKTLGKL